MRLGKGWMRTGGSARPAKMGNDHVDNILSKKIKPPAKMGCSHPPRSTGSRCTGTGPAT